MTSNLSVTVSILELWAKWVNDSDYGSWWRDGLSRNNDKQIITDKMLGWKDVRLDGDAAYLRKAGNIFL